MILGLDDSETYRECLDVTAKHDYPPCEFCILRSPGSDEQQADLQWGSLNLRFSRAALKGLFVPETVPSPQKSSYVDIVQRRISTHGIEVKTEDFLPTPPRKVSNASTISTQAEEEVYTAAQETEPTTSLKVLDAMYYDNLAAVKREFSDLACSTQQRKLRIESRKMEIEAKKIDVGLLAVIPCPREKPDRSTTSFHIS